MTNPFVKTLEKVRADRDLSVFDVTSIEELSNADIHLILELADVFAAAKTTKLELLTGKTAITAFFENSTRTKLSFELAGKHLNADVVSFSAADSSVKKGESLLDTAQTLAALQAQVIVVRSPESGVPYFLSQHIPAAVINAGDGWHEHPSQGLLDVKTIMDHHKTLAGKIITIVGDILHSRVFGSLVRIGKRLGATIRVSCPETFLPAEIGQFGVRFFADVAEALKGADVVYAIRMQQERGAAGYIPSLKDYASGYVINSERFALAKKTAILMDAGPVIRGLSLSSDLLTHERCVVLKQIENGLAVRKALLWLLAERRDRKKKPFCPR